MSNIAITLTSSLKVGDEYLKLTRDAAVLLAQNDFGIVYGGTAYGMMLELAEAYKQAGGKKLIGVMAEDLMKVTKGYVAFDQLDEEHLLPTMEDRKRKIIDEADGFLILPGGYGTFEEIGSIIGGRVNKLFDKPIVVYNPNHFYDELLSFFSSLHKKKFTKIDVDDVVFVTQDLSEALDHFKSYKKSELEDKFV